MEAACRVTPLPDPLVPFRLLRMSLASCKVFRPFLAASSARALAASARARSWSAVCKHVAGKGTALHGEGPLSSQTRCLRYPPEAGQHPAGSGWASAQGPALPTAVTQLTPGPFQTLPREVKQSANQTNLLLGLSFLQKVLYFEFLPSHVLSEVLIILQLLVNQVLEILSLLLYFICLIL